MIRVTTPPDATPEAVDPGAMVSILGADASEQSRIQAMIQDATREAELLACRRLWYREYTEHVTGADTRLYLQVRPVASVTSIKILGDDDEVEAGDDPEEFSIWPEFLFREVGWHVAGTWVCRYFGGYWLPSMTGTKPDAAEDIAVDGRHIRKAVEQIVTATYHRDGKDPHVKSEEKGGDTKMAFEYRNGLAVPEEAKRTLQRLAPIVP